MKLTELLIVIGLIVLVSLWSWSGLSKYSEFEMLTQATETVLSAVETARYNTLESRAGAAYGVHVATSSITVFRGTAYDGSSSENEVYTLDRKISLSSNFTGDGHELFFKRLTGSTEQSGTIVVRSSSGITRTIAISRAGAISSY